MLTEDVNTDVVVVERQVREGHLYPAPPLGDVAAARLGDHVFAALMDVDLAVSVGALHALPPDSTQQAATVVTPRRRKVASRLKLVRLDLLYYGVRVRNIIYQLGVIDC